MIGNWNTAAHYKANEFIADGCFCYIQLPPTLRLLTVFYGHLFQPQLNKCPENTSIIGKI